MSNDILKSFPIERVHRWYHRLADAALSKKINGRHPLSGLLLKTYVTNKDKNKLYIFDAYDYLQRHPKVLTELNYHRQVFLTQSKARLGKGNTSNKWVGLVPRLQDGRWNGSDQIALYYESLVEIGSQSEIWRIQLYGTAEERDLFTSLRGFQLRSDIEVTGFAKGHTISVSFKKWEATALDRYDFNYHEHLTLPNPDYQSSAEDAIHPELQKFRVYHSNAKRLVDHGLAAPFKVKLGPWKVTNPQIIKSGELDPKKRIK